MSVTVKNANGGEVSVNEQSKRLTALIILGVVVVLTFLALDSVITGGSQSFLSQYWMISMSVVVLGAVLVWLKQSSLEPPKRTAPVKKTTKTTKKAASKSKKKK